MPILITVLILAAAFTAYSLYESAQTKKRRDIAVDFQKKYVESTAPNARIIVNNGVHLFFIDDEKQFFGLDISGKHYSFAGLNSISRFSDSITFSHTDGINLFVGKDAAHQENTVALDAQSINAIYAEMMPILRKNVRKVLDKYSVNPTAEYEHDGSIYGYDISSQQFYCVYGGTSVHRFSELKKYTIDNVANNNLCSSNYIMHIYINHEDSSWDEFPEYDLYFDAKDATYNNILAMLKYIRSHQ